VTDNHSTPDPSGSQVKTIDPEWLDADGYPTEAAIKRIQDWGSDDIPGCFTFIESLWWCPEFGFSRELNQAEAEVAGIENDEAVVRLATGGWSGNESIVYALRDNVLLCVLTWRLSGRGGLHIYAYPQSSPTAVPHG
jgi:hypothetical protein